MTVCREIAALLAGWNTKGIVEWARLHVSQNRAHPRSCYLAAAPVALGALVAAAAGAVSFATAG